MKKLIDFLKNEDASAMVEYVSVTTVVGGGSIAATTVLRDSQVDRINNLNDVLETATSGP